MLLGSQVSQRCGLHSRSSRFQVCFEFERSRGKTRMSLIVIVIVKEVRSEPPCTIKYQKTRAKTFTCGASCQLMVRPPAHT